MWLRVWIRVDKDKFYWIFFIIWWRISLLCRESVSCGVMLINVSERECRGLK